MLLCMNCVDVWSMLVLVLQIAKTVISPLMAINYFCQMIFLVADLTNMTLKGFLTFVTIPMFKTIWEIEGVIKWHFNNPGHFYVLDTFQHCLTKIRFLHLMPIFCDQHREALIP